MKIVQINATCGIGSTGKICVGISEILARQNIENYILCSKSNGHGAGIVCADDRYIKMQALKSKLLGSYGFYSKKATKKIIHELEKINPDVVHLHNIHGHDCDLETLFTYFKKKKTKLFWTFHDCWAFTGYCVYFDTAKCEKWKEQCHDCVQKPFYSWLFDKSSQLHQKKKELFSGLDLRIITPSKWLADMAKQSFLGEYPVQVINNGIDLSVFKPTPSNFRQKYGLEDQKILLGVAFDWGKRKGLDVLIELSKRLPPNYQIVLVGGNAQIDQLLPGNIISIHRTQNQRELAEIYSAADLFVNPTREDTYPTVNMESLACGTPVLTFKTGGSPEMLDESCGFAVDCDDVDGMEREILRIIEEQPFSEQACVARAASFDKDKRFQEYLALYQSM